MQAVMSHVCRAIYSLLNPFTHIISLKKQVWEMTTKKKKKINFITLQFGYNVLFFRDYLFLHIGSHFYVYEVHVYTKHLSRQSVNVASFF